MVSCRPPISIIEWMDLKPQHWNISKLFIMCSSYYVHYLKRSLQRCVGGAIVISILSSSSEVWFLASGRTAGPSQRKDWHPGQLTSLPALYLLYNNSAIVAAGWGQVSRSITGIANLRSLVQRGQLIQEGNNKNLVSRSGSGGTWIMSLHDKDKPLAGLFYALCLWDRAPQWLRSEDTGGCGALSPGSSTLCLCNIWQVA